MRRQGQYADSSMNSYIAQMQHMSAQRMQQNSRMNHFPGRPDALSLEEERAYSSSKGEGQWQWDRDRDGSKASHPMSPHLYKEGQGEDVSRSFYRGQRPDPEISLEKQANKDSRALPHEQDMEIGYEDNLLPQTYEGLEQKFLDEIMKLTKDQNDAEDAENARHREKINEINAQYQEKLVSLRAQHANRRDEFLHRESQARQLQHQQAMSHHQSSIGPSDHHGYSGAAAAAAEANQSYAAGQFDSYRERAQFLGSGRSHGFESRGPYPGGRAYNTGARYY